MTALSVRDDKGRKMSKSLGNGIDPLDIVSEYGADALRIALLTGNAPGNDMRFYESRVEASRNFLNKVWNATRFIVMNDLDPHDKFDEKDIEKFQFNNLEDKWIISRLNTTIKDVTNNIEKYELGIALEKIQKFVWEEFCDWFIEFKKSILYNGTMEEKKDAIYVLKYVLNNSLKLLHPFCPFITEEIYEKLFDGKLLIKAEFPEYNFKFNFEKEEQALDYIRLVITAIRNRRAELNVPKDKIPDIKVLTNDEHIKDSYRLCEKFIKTLSLVNDIEYVTGIENVDKYIALTFDKSIVYIPFEELVDIEKEKERILGEIKRVESEILRAKNMLSNEKFVSKAPETKINEENEKLKKYEQMLIDLNNTLEKL